MVTDWATLLDSDLRIVEVAATFQAEIPISGGRLSADVVS